MELVEQLKDEVRLRNLKDTKDVQPVISELLANMLDEGKEAQQLNLQADGLTVILVVGVNGVGKTTSIGKMAHYLTQEGKK